MQRQSISLQGNMHPHRLIYLHTSGKEKTKAFDSFRFRTQPNETSKERQAISKKMDMSMRYETQPERSSSKGKIHYFEMNITDLVSQAQAQSKQSLKDVTNLSKKGLVEIKQKQTHRQKLSKTSSEATLRKGKRAQGNPDMQRLFESQIESNLFNSKHSLQMIDLQKTIKSKLYLPKKQSKKDQNHKPSTAQHNNFKKIYAKIQAPRYLNKTKKPILKQQSSEFELRRLQKIIEDSAGRVYKVAIQRLV